MTMRKRTTRKETKMNKNEPFIRIKVWFSRTTRELVFAVDREEIPLELLEHRVDGMRLKCDVSNVNDSSQSLTFMVKGSHANQKFIAFSTDITEFHAERQQLKVRVRELIIRGASSHRFKLDESLECGDLVVEDHLELITPVMVNIESF